jgi:hypothetical protein
VSVAVTFLMVTLVVIMVGWLIHRGQSEYGLWGPETLSHSPPIGRRQCCCGVSGDECAEWWESYQWRWVRLGDGSLWRKVVRESTFESELHGHKWEPYQAEVGQYPAPNNDAALAAIERRILSGELQDRQNVALNGWHW